LDNGLFERIDRKEEELGAGIQTLKSYLCSWRKHPLVSATPTAAVVLGQSQIETIPNLKCRVRVGRELKAGRGPPQQNPADSLAC